MPEALLITCEHGGNRIPARYREYFRGQQALLESHRGYDAGALTLARALAGAFRAPLVAATTSRLLVDLNRSVGHRGLHFDPIARLPVAERQRILAEHYAPHRARVEQLAARCIAEQGTVVHVACHSFTPVLDGRRRSADIGLLYDPARAGEVEFCARWKAALRDCLPGHVVRRNYPYQGSEDGLTTSLRERFAPDAYLGIELEMNQRLVDSPARRWSGLRQQIADSLCMVLAGMFRQRTASPQSRRRSVPTGVPN